MNRAYAWEMDQARLYSLYETDPGPEIGFLRWLVESSSPPARPRVLDVGCGPGRLLRPLSRLGWRVRGLEPDPQYADAAAAKVRGLEGADVRNGGFGDIDETAEYDLIAAVNGPYSYLLDLDARREALDRCARALRPGGLLFLHFSNFWWILRHYREPPEQAVEVDGVRVVRTAVHWIDYHRGRFTHVDTFRWTDADGTKRETRKTHEMAMVDPPETERLLGNAGLVEIRTFNGYEDRKPAPLAAKRVLVVARKPPA